MLRTRLDEMVRRFELVRREELDAVQEMAANARTGQETAEARLAEALTRIAALESRVSSLEEQSRRPDPAAAP